MRVTARGEYATQAVLHLAMQYPEVVAIHDIAERHHIPLKYLEQILLELKRGGILDSRRGVHGGYTIARSPEQMSIGDSLRRSPDNLSIGGVLPLVDGAFAKSGCTHAETRVGMVCAEGPSCGLKQV